MNFYLYHNPIGVIDVDTHDSEINPNNFRDSLNIRNVTSYVGKKQVLSNLKGNLIVSYNLGSTKAKVIGSYEDKAGQTILYFLWDKDLNHRILRYYPNKISSTFPRGQIEEIIRFDFGWKENTKITNIDLVDGKLLYWTDPKPRKINIEKANINGKLKTWKVIFPENYTSALFAPNLSVAVKNRETGLGGLTDTTFSFLANTPRVTVLSTFTTYLNSIFGTFPNEYISATLCDDCSIEVEEIKAGDWNLTITGTAPFLVISDNWYGNTPLLSNNGLSERTFDRIKYPPVYQPLNEHKQDLVKNYNYIKGKVFQFRTQFHYDDNESSKLSPISQISINNTENITDEPLYNYIQVNLNNDIFTNDVLTLIDRVSILFREGNIGEWQKIDDFDICQLYYYESFTKKLIYNFYNNTSSSGISDILSVAQYDKVAIEAQASSVIENRILDGNITDDYDVERCIDVDVEITIGDAVQEEFVTLYGYIKIHSYRMNDSSYRSAAAPNNFPFYSFPYIEPQSGKLRGVISHDTSNPANYPTFGGLMYGYGDGWDFGMTANISETWNQTLPEGGFPVYSAGTEFLTVSRQVQVGGLGVTDGGAFDVSSASKIAQIGAYLQNVNNQCYSLFTLQVPKSKHVIRLASHLCSFDDKLNLGDCYNLTNNSYQKTSTYVNGYFDSSNVWQGGKKEIVVDATAMTGDNFIGTFVVQDLCPSFDELLDTSDSIIDDNSTYYYAWKNIVGYLYDDNGAVNPNDAGYDGIPVTGAYVRGTVFDNRFPTNAFYDERLDTFTDHNGFFFFTAMRHDNDADDSALYISAFQVAPLINPPFVGGGEYGHGNNNPVVPLPNYLFYTTFGEVAANYANIDVFPNTGNCTTIHSFSQNKYAGYLSNLINKTLTPTLYGWDVPSTFPTVVLELDSSGTTNIVISTDVANLRTTHAVSVSGNASVEGASIIATGGAVAKAIVGGSYQMYVWANMYYSSRYDTTNGGAFSDSALDPFVVFSHNNDRVFDIIFQKGSLNLGVPVPTSYSHTVTFPAANIINEDFTVSTIAGLVDKALKRGGNYAAGVRYYDSANRSSDVLIDPSMNFYIPFITEDLNKYLPNYAVTTYRTGVPSVQFTLNHTPPSWANTFQILISENLNQLNFLQFKVNEVKYVVQSASDGVPELTTNELNSSVTQLKISLENINIYYRKNNDSNVGWNYTKGDKIRLITNGEGTYYQGLYEFEVVGYEAPNWYLIKYNGTDVKIGSLIEIFSQKINSSEQLFYEMGECFPISAHATPITLSGGDTYWRKRTIPVINDYFNIYNNYPATIEANTISDFYPSKSSDIGRIGINDPNYKRTYKISSIRLSNNYIVGSQINGLSENENVDDIDLGIIYGGIRHFVELGENILSVNENRVIALYKGNVLAKTGETGLLAITNEFIGDRRPLLGDFGSQNPESIKRNDNEVYGYDAYRGIVWKYDNNGFNLISSNGMKTYFEGISNLGVWESPSVYDTRYDEYILSIYPNIVGEVVLGGGNVLTGTTLQFADAAVYDNLAVGDMIIVSYKKLGVTKETNGIVTVHGVTITATVDNIGSAADPASTIFIKFKDKARMTTIAYSPINKGWTSKYSFTPEYYGSFKKDIVSFVNGDLWVHDVNPLRNTFYGTAYKSFITFVANGLSTKGIGNIVKIFKAITLVGKQLSGGNNWSAPTISNGTQLSRLLVSKFVKREENWHSEFMRDINSTGGILNGNTLRSEQLTINLENNATEEVVLEQVNILANDSKRN